MVSLSLRLTGSPCPELEAQCIHIEPETNVILQHCLLLYCAENSDEEEGICQEST